MITYAKSLEFTKAPDFNLLRSEVRTNMKHNGLVFDYIFDWRIKNNIEKEMEEMKEKLKKENLIMNELKNQEGSMQKYLEGNIMETYDFKELRKTLIAMFAFDEINLLDDEIGENVKIEIESEKKKHNEFIQKINQKNGNKKQKICNLF